MADWAALLTREGVAAASDDERLLADVVIAEPEQHPFTALDVAMTLLVCDACGAELGASYRQDCWPCAQAFGNALWAENNGGAGMLEHAWHIGRWVARHHTRHSEATVIGWTSNLPRLLAGELPTTAEAQRMSRELKRDVRRRE